MKSSQAKVMTSKNTLSKFAALKFRANYRTLLFNPVQSTIGMDSRNVKATTIETKGVKVDPSECMGVANLNFRIDSRNGPQGPETCF